MCFLMNLATVYFAHHKTHNISKLKFHLNKYEYGAYSMLNLACFGDFEILSKRQFHFKELGVTKYEAKHPKIYSK